MELIKGPYLCNSFDEFNADVCTQCSHWGRIKSPIVLGNRVIPATAADNVVKVPTTPVEPELTADLPASTTHVIPAYPKPFFRGVNGGVYIRTTDADGDPDEKLVYHNDIYVTRRISDIEMGEAVVVKLHLPRDGVREFTMPLTSVTSKEDLRKHMAMHGVAVTRMDDLMSYMTTWVNELQATSVATEARRQFGWTDDKFKSFVLGDKEIFGHTISCFTRLNPRVLCKSGSTWLTSTTVTGLNYTNIS
jgi:hypothetical protein